VVGENVGEGRAGGGRVKVKICGITNLEDALVAVQAGADFLGFICYPPSPRYLPPEEAGRIVAALKASGSVARSVGVFVNASLPEIEWAMAAASFDLAQLHGDEPAELVAALGGRAYKAVRPRDADEAMTAAPFLEVAPADLQRPQILVDAYHPRAYGGTGQVGDWRVARSLARRAPRLLLAGGLTPGNVVEAIAQVHPWGVDVSSGVEVAPGRKDHDRVWAFVSAARAAAS